jgi:hypothetical protein
MLLVDQFAPPRAAGHAVNHQSLGDGPQRRPARPLIDDPADHRLWQH